MDDLIETTQQRSDAQLIAAVRAGDTAAYGLLFQRHAAAATRLSRQLLSTGEADDLVSEAFLKVLSLLQDGKGPDEAFRAYLLTAVRRLHVDRIRATTRTRPTDDEHVLDRGVPFDDAVSAAFENDAAARAFASLPERWQLVLWHLEVEGQKPAAVAPLLGMSPNSVSALAYRAREGLRAAYLESHAAATTDEACRAVTPLLGGFVRQTLSARDTAKVDRHLDGCRRCTGVHLELVEVNQNLRGLLAPALLGPAAAGYLGATGTAAAALGAGGIAAGGAWATAGTAAGGSLAVGTTAAGGGFAAASGYAGATMLTSAIVSQVARVALVPAQAAAATAVSAGTPAVVATTVVTGALTTGMVVGGTDLLTSAPPAVVASPSPSSPLAPESTAAPTTEPTPEPTTEPTPEPSAEPTPETPVETTPPAPTPATADTSASPDQPVSEQPVATPTPPPVTPTDFSLGAATVTNDSTLLQRRVVVPIAADGGSNPVARTVTMTVSFDRTVKFRGIPGDGWACDATRNQRLRTLRCSATLPAGQGGSFPFKVIGARPAATVTVTAPDDPRSDNDTTTFRSTGWLLPI
ncbi:sigma-70 family RNA polymerase sigma factor [Aeromicrobium sp.]|uniref:sigma-70 family RNA polymerase sigma factor n=4 Tax=Aeromicrobium sp. TaxID=1871063 RepID=UPI004034165A